MANVKLTPEEKGRMQAKAERDADRGTYDGPFGLGLLTGEREAKLETEVYNPTWRQRNARNKG